MGTFNHQHGGESNNIDQDDNGDIISIFSDSELSIISTTEDIPKVPVADI